MDVKLISYSQPAVDFDIPNDVLQLVAYCARVSNPENQHNEESAEKLVKYLMKHKHWSPLEMVSVCLEINCPRDIGRQILRHRSFSFQEFSQRYADPTNDLKFTTREARLQDKKNRQNSIELNSDDPINYVWESYQETIIERCKTAYNWAIEAGIAKEQARAVLPEGLTMSRMYVNGTLRSWIHYIELRSEHGTQLEHIKIAKECGKIIDKIFTPM
ncbi:MAG: FAD-dependent thymidylate synthase [Pirellulales bacterium]|nr:FAD-dependent thymidylate synthase [Pirellulales bacterium]